ncbi:YciI family protein [Nocardia thailandica]|uniref:YciI family protein n=1 Tax=Nocardia thailandica TaxID=257275 RepID=UPI000A01D325|nr:YciI family protein [Nocardia thailandica]
MAIYAVTYTYDPKLADARAAVRGEHNDWLLTLVNQDRALCTGPFSDGGGGLLIFEADSEHLLTALLEEDPFARENLIESTQVREWRPIHGQVGNSSRDLDRKPLQSRVVEVNATSRL